MMNSLSHGPHQRAFTLVELLVVIGIIALLISILLPALGRARDSANRAACLSNLRTIGQMYLMYAQDNKGQIPLGTQSNVYQESYWIRLNGRYPSWGPFYLGRFMKTPKAYYCPSSNSDLWYQYNAINNKWDPDNSNVRAGYFMRPMYFDETPILWQQAGTSAPIPVNGKAQTNNLGGQEPWFPYPKIEKLKMRALVADLFHSPSRIRYMHKKGINALYADGSAKWQDAKQFNNLPTTWPKPSWVNWSASVLPFTDAALPDTVGQTANGTMACIWEILDRNGGAPGNPGFVFP